MDLWKISFSIIRQSSKQNINEPSFVKKSKIENPVAWIVLSYVKSTRHLMAKQRREHIIGLAALKINFSSVVSPPPPRCQYLESVRLPRIFVDAQIGVKFNHLIIGSIQSNHSLRVCVCDGIPELKFKQSDTENTRSRFFLFNTKNQLLKICYHEIAQLHQRATTSEFTVCLVCLSIAFSHILLSDRQTGKQLSHKPTWHTLCVLSFVFHLLSLYVIHITPSDLFRVYQFISHSFLFFAWTCFI